MLLFIDGVLTAFVAVFVFQYISCYSLSSGRCMSLELPAVSIHLMLLFIAEDLVLFPPGTDVSIHLMLLFIARLRLHQIHGRCFNTSHVTLYQFWTIALGSVIIGFNTSHVTLYPISDFASRYAQRSFNTSHVTLYRITEW